MNVLPAAKRELVLRCLLDGASIRATARIADVAKGTVLKLLVDVGRASAAYQDRMLRDLPCRRIEVDEIWSSIYAKKAHLSRLKRRPADAGDVWTWVALCADTKLVPTWRVGDRTLETAAEFMTDLQGRLRHRVQLTSDQSEPYIDAVDFAFGRDVDYTMLQKTVRDDRIAGVYATHLQGRARPESVSTSLVERNNLTMRMNMRRFTRATNAFSKKVENHAAAVALHFMHYNFCRVHETIRVTPAMEAGVTDTMLDVDFIVTLVEDAMPAEDAHFQRP